MGKNRYKFIFNQPPPTDQQIAAHMDFESLLAQHQSTKKKGGMVKVFYWLAPAAAAAVLGWLFFANFFGSTSNDQYQIAEQAYFQEQPFVNPPMPEIQAAFVSQKMDAYKGGSFTNKNGSTVIVPKAAFVNEAGEVIGGEVEILYREYHDYVDFFLSGIPMHYDSSGVRYQLESAGMMELYAEQDGKRLNVAPGKEIQVELKGEVFVDANQPNKLPQFNIYKLNVAERNWNYKGADKIEWADKLLDVKSASAKAKRAFDREKKSIASKRTADLEAAEGSILKPVAPRQPTQTRPDDFTFDLAFNEFDDPSLVGLKEQYEGTLWKVVENEQSFNSEMAKGVQWEDMDLKKLNELDFELTLFSGGNSIKVIVNPVLTGEKLQQAISSYNAAQSNYNNQLIDWEKAVASKKESLNRKYDALLLAANNEYEDALSGVEKNANRSIKRKVINRFTADKLGIWNCDFPTKPYDAKVNGQFVDDSQKALNENTGYLVDQNRNSLGKFYTTTDTPVSYNSQSANLMWIVAEDGNIAVFKPEHFEGIKSNDDSYTFKMNRVDKNISSEAELRRVLEF